MFNKIMDFTFGAKIVYLPTAWILILTCHSLASTIFTTMPQNVTLHEEKSFYLNCSLYAPSKHGIDWWYARSDAEKPEPICQSVGQNTTLICDPPNLYSVEQPDDRTVNLIVKSAITGKFCCLSENGDREHSGTACAYVTSTYSTTSSVDTSTGKEVTAPPSTHMTEESQPSVGAIIGIVVGVVVGVAVVVVTIYICKKRNDRKERNVNQDPAEAGDPML